MNAGLTGAVKRIRVRRASAYTPSSIVRSIENGPRSLLRGPLATADVEFAELTLSFAFPAKQPEGAEAEQIICLFAQKLCLLDMIEY